MINALKNNNITFGTKSKISSKYSTIMAALLGFSGFLIVFSWDTSFNMQVLSPIMLLSILIYFVANRGIIKTNRQFKLTLSIILVYCVPIITNALLNINLITSSSIIRILYSSLIIIFYSISISFNFNNSNLKTIIYGNVLSEFFISILIILNWLSGARGKISVLSIFGKSIEENYTGAILAFYTTLTVILFLYSKGVMKKIILFIGAIVSLFAIFLTGSRSALIATIIACFFALIQFIFSRNKSIIKKILLCILIPIFIFIFFDIVQRLLPDFLYNRMIDNLIFGLNDSSNENRMALWSYALKNYIYRPLFGFGIGNFNYYVRQIFPQHTVVVAHNTFIDILIDTGCIGFLLFFITIGRNFKNIFSKNCNILLPCLFVLFFTAFIVGGERTFFFWNGCIVLSIFCIYSKKNTIKLSQLLEET